MKNTVLQSQVIDWLRFPLIIGVVFIHSFGSHTYDLQIMHSDPFSGVSTFNWIRICLSNVITHISVPVFYLISGYLFFYNLGGAFDINIFKNKIKKRFRSLFIPYLLWNLIAILIVVILKLGAHIVKKKPLSNILVWFQDNGWWHLFWDNNVWGENSISWAGTVIPMTGPADLPLWYLRDLMVIVLISPLVFYYLKYTKFYGIFILALAYISKIWPNIHGLSITAVFFFSVGAYFSLNDKNLVDEFNKIRIPAYVLFMLLLFPMIWFNGKNTFIGSLIYPVFIIIGVCVIFNISSMLIEKEKVKVIPLLTQSTFFIYALHTLVVLRICSFIINGIIGSTNALALTISYLMTPILTIFCCLALYVLMKRFFPRLLGLLTGDRV